MVVVHPHLAVAVIAERAHRACSNGMRVMVDAETVALGVAVGEQTALEHLVRRETDAGNQPLAGLNAACSTSAK